MVCKRLSLTRHIKVHDEPKTRCSNDTTHVIFEPPDFVARPVALIPQPRVHLTEFTV